MADLSVWVAGRGQGRSQIMRPATDPLTVSKTESVTVGQSFGYGWGSGTTITASACTRAAFDMAYASAVNGDTIQIPAGTATDWTTTKIIDKVLTIRGLGTITTDGNGRATDCATRIVHNSGSYVFTVNLASGGLTRFSGLEFGHGTESSYVFFINAACEADAHRLRIDHCNFDDLRGGVMFSYGVYGVCDHCTITCDDAVAFSGWWGFFKGDTYNGDNDAGDYIWAQPDNFGTEKFFFIENCTANRVGSYHRTFTDGQGGGRYVVRYCDMTNASMDGHGNESGAGERSTRAVEWYNNTWTGSGTGQSISHIRGGCGLIHDNTITGYTTSAVFNLLDNRRGANELAQPFWGADGHNPWDINEAPSLTGTALAGSGSNSLTTSGLTPSAWIGYTLRKTSTALAVSVNGMTRSGSTVTVNTTSAHGLTNGDIVSIFNATEYQYNGWFSVGSTPSATQFTFAFQAPYTPASPATTTSTIYVSKRSHFGYIESNSSTVITTSGGLFDNPIYVSGEGYEIVRPLQTFDQIGVGHPTTAGIDLGGDRYGLAIPGGWNDQVVSPWYIWNNTREGSVAVEGLGTRANIVIGTHIVNGSAKPGYTPYTYPHPLSLTP